MTTTETTTRKGRIISVKVITRTDTDPDASYLGEYSNTPGKGAIDRQARGDMEHGQYRYFNPSMTGAETGNMESPEQDYQRMEALNRGDWGYVGIIAEAEVVLPGSNVVQKIKSGGLWGVESDNSKEYLEEIAQEELRQLGNELKQLGYGRRAITATLAIAERVNK